MEDLTVKELMQLISKAEDHYSNRDPLDKWLLGSSDDVKSVVTSLFALEQKETKKFYSFYMPFAAVPPSLIDKLKKIKISFEVETDVEQVYGVLGSSEGNFINGSTIKLIK